MLPPFVMRECFQNNSRVNSMIKITCSHFPTRRPMSPLERRPMSPLERRPMCGRLLPSLLMGVLILGVTHSTTWGQSDNRIKPSALNQDSTPANRPEVAPAKPATGPQDTPKSDQAFEPKRIESINERIQLLKKLMQQEREQAERQEQEGQLDQLPPNNATTQPNFPNNNSANPTTAEETGQPEEFTPSLPVDPNAASQDAGTPILTQPVNSFELGNSLFMTGNYSAALKSYQAMLNEKPAVEDELWIRCMMGCCYRLQGDFAKAESMFREITNRRLTNSYPSDYAKWSLNYIEKRRISHDQFRLIESELDTVIAELKNETTNK